MQFLVPRKKHGQKQTVGLSQFSGPCIITLLFRTMIFYAV
jgi:hypothetical protein